MSTKEMKGSGRKDGEDGDTEIEEDTRVVSQIRNGGENTHTLK